MSGVLYEISALAVVPPLAVVLSLGAWLVLRRRGALSARRLLAWWVTCWYLLAVVAVTLFPLQVALGAYGNRSPWYEKMNFIPVLTIDPTTFVLNIIMFVPLGVLLPLVTRVRGVRHVALVSLTVSGVVEMLQFLSNVLVSSGRLADLNDLLANTLGGVLGFLAWRVLGGPSTAERFMNPDRAPQVRQPVG
ncbi:VanZ family protein [Micromonospora sp. CPCC 205739]|uniref:VanZ family protein n=1 Tax=Micromonospora sp. CPCC 205739 TaxID=3122404 RepID=UPI002FF312AF